MITLVLQLNAMRFNDAKITKLSAFCHPTFTSDRVESSRISGRLTGHTSLSSGNRRGESARMRKMAIFLEAAIWSAAVDSMSRRSATSEAVEAKNSAFDARRGRRILPAEARTETTTTAPKSATSRMLAPKTTCAGTA